MFILITRFQFPSMRIMVNERLADNDKLFFFFFFFFLDSEPF